MGAPISGAVVEIEGGSYLFSSNAIPDGHRGGVKFLSGATFKAFAAISPQDYENLDVKVSSIESGSGDDPLGNQVPGVYDPGTAGYIIGQLSGTEVVTSSAPVVTSSGDIELVKGQDYRQEDGNAITFTNTDTWPALGNGTVTFEAFGGVPIDMDVVQLGATQIVRLNLEDTVTADLPLNRYRYEVKVQLSNGNVYTLASGRILFV